MLTSSKITTIITPKWVYIPGIEEKHFTDTKIFDFLLITPRSRLYQLSNINDVILSERFLIQHVIHKTRSETSLYCRAKCFLSQAAKQHCFIFFQLLLKAQRSSSGPHIQRTIQGHITNGNSWSLYQSPHYFSKNPRAGQKPVLHTWLIALGTSLKSIPDRWIFSIFNDIQGRKFLSTKFRL